MSLLELPSIFFEGKLHSKALFQTRDLYPYSQCQNSNEIIMKLCLDAWYSFMNENKTHPCETKPKCCNIWPKIMKNSHLPIMRVMRMASMRGQSHYKFEDFLQPFIQNNEKMKYPVNINLSLTYAEIVSKEVRDEVSILPFCNYLKPLGSSIKQGV